VTKQEQNTFTEAAHHCDGLGWESTAVDLLALRDKLERAEEILLGYEQWEANLVLKANWEATRDGLPALTYPLYDELMELQGRRNELLGRGLFARKEPANA
jgi:hypothetical protein